MVALRRGGALLFAAINSEERIWLQLGFGFGESFCPVLMEVKML